MSAICNIPLATKVPDNKGAGILNLSNIRMKMIEATKRISKSK